MRQRAEVVVLVSVSIALFFIVAPVVCTIKFAFTVYTSVGCSDV